MKKESYDFFIYSLSLKVWFWKSTNLEELKSLNNVEDIRKQISYAERPQESCKQLCLLSNGEQVGKLPTPSY
jgi:hypothetical protein